MSVPVLDKLREYFTSDEAIIKFLLHYLNQQASYSEAKLLEHIERTFNP